MRYFTFTPENDQPQDRVIVMSDSGKGHSMFFIVNRVLITRTPWTIEEMTLYASVKTANEITLEEAKLILHIDPRPGQLICDTQDELDFNDLLKKLYPGVGVELAPSRSIK